MNISRVRSPDTSPSARAARRAPALALAAIAALLAWPALAGAQPGGKPRGARSGHAADLLERRLAGVKVLRRGTLAEMRAHKVEVGGGKRMTIGELSDKLFAEEDEFQAELSGGRSALMGDPTSADEVVETDDATILVKTTSAVVRDPEALAKRSKHFKRFRKGAGAPTVADLGDKAGARFQAWKRELESLAADHPLRQAAAQGDDALLAAVAAGVGDMSVTTAVVVPKKDLAVQDGVAQLPSYQDGRLDLGKTRPGKRRLGRAEADDHEVAGPPALEEKGRLVHKAQFLTGFTVGDAFEWSRRWKFPSGFFEVNAGAYYAFGLRAPVEVKAVMSPAKIVAKGAKDTRRADFQVELSARTLDGDSAYYRATGLGAEDVLGGDELVLEAGFHMGYELEAGWGLFHKRERVGTDFDRGRSFRPPFGKDCVKNSRGQCGVDFWIPAEVTKTGIRIGTDKLHIGGAALLGFLLAGDGSATVTYQSVFADGALESRRAGRKDSAAMSHELTFAGDAGITMDSDMPALGKPGTRRYGFRIAQPSYRWDMRLIPGVKVEIDIKAGKVLDRTFTAGPLWLDSLGLDLGSVTLGKHKGTRGTYRFVEGEHTWQD